MGALLIPVVIALIALIVGAITAKRFIARERARADRLTSDQETALRYRVPSGQDPAAVLLGLDRAGYEAVLDPALGATNELVIAKRGDQRLDREQLRRVLANTTQVDMEGDHVASLPPIRFADE